jgi:hypothetical protein
MHTKRVLIFDIDKNRHYLPRSFGGTHLILSGYRLPVYKPFVLQQWSLPSWLGAHRPDETCKSGVDQTARLCYTDSQPVDIDMVHCIHSKHEMRSFWLFDHLPYHIIATTCETSQASRDKNWPLSFFSQGGLIAGKWSWLGTVIRTKMETVTMCFDPFSW